MTLGGRNWTMKGRMTLTLSTRVGCEYRVKWNEPKKRKEEPQEGGEGSRSCPVKKSKSRLDG